MEFGVIIDPSPCPECGVDVYRFQGYAESGDIMPCSTPVTPSRSGWRPHTHGGEPDDIEALKRRLAS